MDIYLIKHVCIYDKRFQDIQNINQIAGMAGMADRIDIGNKKAVDDYLKIAEKEGVETIQKPFTDSLGREIANHYGKADIVTATNVFAHMASLGEVIRGIENVLNDDGVFIFENQNI